MTSTTPNYDFYLPEINGDEAEWGQMLNANTTALDEILATIAGLGVGVEEAPADGQNYVRNGLDNEWNVALSEAESALEYVPLATLAEFMDWQQQDSSYSLSLGDRRIAVDQGLIEWNLPDIDFDTAPPNDIWAWNARGGDNGLRNIEIAPQAGKIIIHNGATLAADAKVLLAPGGMAICIPLGATYSNKWAVKTF